MCSAVYSHQIVHGTTCNSWTILIREDKKNYPKNNIRHDLVTCDDCGSGSMGIVEIKDIGDKALFELFDSLETASIQFLFFQIPEPEKSLHDSVVI